MRRPLPLSLGAAWVALAAVALAGPEVARAEDAFEVEAVGLRKALASPASEERRAAFERVRTLSDPRAFGLLVGATDTIERERDLAAASLVKARAELEASRLSIDKEVRAYERLDAPGGAAVDRHADRMAALEGRRRMAGRAVAELEAEGGRRERELDDAGAAAAGVLSRLPEDEVPGAIERLDRAWLHGGGSSLDDRVRFVDAIERRSHPAVAEALRRASFDLDADPRLRAVALAARVERRDVGVLEDAIGLLADPASRVEAQAVEGLRLLHERQAIEPLIALLGRDDLGRVREDAHRALQSLTGERHGPYRQPWADWWDVARRQFEMPKKSTSAAELLRPEKGLTFYGIPTFSKRVVFVVDVSASMLEPEHAGRGGPPTRKIDAARREVTATVGALDEGAKFGIVLFEDGVRRFDPALAVSDKGTRSRAVAWVRSEEPRGGTDIYGALRAAFELATAGVTAKSPNGGADTIYFLTDGRPTAGTSSRTTAWSR